MVVMTKLAVNNNGFTGVNPTLIWISKEALAYYVTLDHKLIHQI